MPRPTAVPLLRRTFVRKAATLATAAGLMAAGLAAPGIARAEEGRLRIAQQFGQGTITNTATTIYFYRADGRFEAARLDPVQGDLPGRALQALGQRSQHEDGHRYHCRHAEQNGRSLIARQAGDVAQPRPCPQTGHCHVHALRGDLVVAVRDLFELLEVA